MDIIHFLITGSFDTSNLSQLDTIVRERSISLTIGSSIFLIILVVIAALVRRPNNLVKWLLFSSMVLIISVNTLYLAGATVYKNQRSETGGPVHWHADYQIWNCGREIELKNPEGFSNKVGTELVHEHNDNRMHIEGVILNLDDSTPSHFFESLGGSMSNTHLRVPTEEGVVTMENGQNCPDGKTGILQVFVYKTEGGTVSQTKLEEPQNYRITQTGNVPPGDCLIFEFDSEIKDRTDKLCTSYQVAEEVEKKHVE